MVLRSNAAIVLPGGRRASLRWRCRRRWSRSASSYSHSVANACGIGQLCFAAASTTSSQQAAMVGRRSWRRRIGKVAASAMTGHLEQAVVVGKLVLSNIERYDRRLSRLPEAVLQLDQGGVASFI